jgi:hypothetical protein
MLQANYSNSSTDEMDSVKVHAKVSTETILTESIVDPNSKGVKINNNGSAIVNSIINPASIVTNTVGGVLDSEGTLRNNNGHSSTDEINSAEVHAKVSAEMLLAESIVEPDSEGV